MQDSVQDMVRMFNEANPMWKTPDNPVSLDTDADALALNLLGEELVEFADASKFSVDDRQESLTRIDFTPFSRHLGTNLIEQADALGDLVIIAYGEALKRGIDLDAVIAEQMRANMSKLVDGKAVVNGYDSEGNATMMQRNDLPRGKILKGPNYVAPDLTKVVLF